VDTSVWLPALARKTGRANASVEKLTRMISMEQNILILGLILFEVLQGFKGEKEKKQLEADLSLFPLLELTRNDYIYAASLSANCRAKGVTPGTIDAIIAAAAIRYDCYLLTADKDFEHIAKVSPLKLLAE
jgi:predicted nucleic acid-binding protein